MPDLDPPHAIGGHPARADPGGGAVPTFDDREQLLLRLEVAQAAAGIGVHDYDIPADRIAWDGRVRAIWGVGADEAITYATFAAGVHPDDLAAVEQAVQAATDPGGAGQYLARYRVIGRDGVTRHVEATGRAIFHGDTAVRLIGTVRDITAEIAAARELETARAFAENLVLSAPTLLYVYDLVARRNIFIGPQVGPMTRMTQDDYQALGDELIAMVIHPDDVDRVVAHHQAIRDQTIEPPFEIEYRLRRADGGWVWLSSREVVHARDETGRPTQILGTSVDITERREAEAMRELLIGEMAHRMKNLLGVVQSIAALTLRKDCPPAVWAGFERRLGALVAAQQLLTSGDWQRADLGELARAVLQPFDIEAGRISFDGPVLPVDSRQIPTIALALHELATNAVKHGALSGPDGRIALAWSREGDAKVLQWRERGGPPAAPPARMGFGLRMIELLSAQRGGAQLQFGDEGFSGRFAF